MVNGTLDKLGEFLPKSVKDKVLEYVKTVDENTPDGYTYLCDKNVYGRVMGYSTQYRKDCKIEAHNQYVDIQITLVGTEVIDVFERKELTVCQPYNEIKDVEFFKRGEKGYFGTVNNIPGRFSMFFPEDAHSPKIALNDQPEEIRKYVIKIDMELFHAESNHA